MKPITNGCLLLAMLLVSTIAVHAQSAATTNSNSQNAEMKTYVIEREIPDAGKLTAEQLKAISQKSCGVLQEMGSRIQWIHSYVTGNKIYCIYKAENEELIRKHASTGGFPANTIVQVSAVISPATAQ
jgi:hypothetical protein